MDSMSEAMRESDNALILAGFEMASVALANRGSSAVTDGWIDIEDTYYKLRNAVLNRMNGK